jgi:small GTP-binding protein domain
MHGVIFNEESSIMQHISEVSRMGFGDVVPISAEHGEGMADLATIVDGLANRKLKMLGLSMDQEESEMTNKKELEEKNEQPLRLAILGRQNVGKSTLVNSLLHQDRVITGNKPGLTRDAIAIKWSWQGKPVELVDTAGIRRMAKRDHCDNIEDLAVRDAMRAMKVADVAVLVLDAEARMLQRQELAIADAVVREGRSLVVAANKMDLLVDKEYSKEEYADGVRRQIETRFPMLRFTPVVPMSSLTGESVADLMPTVFNARDRWARVISTGLLNRWLKDVMDGQAPPIVQGRQVRIKYIMQTKGRPPTFLLFCNVDVIPVSYMRYLTRNFQETFEMFGMEVRLAVKTGSNPYHDKSKNTRVGKGIGGSEARKSKMIAELKATGKPLKKGVSRRRQKYFK